MPDVYELYNKYVHINGKWELLSGSKTSSSESVLYFKESITSTQLASLDIDDPDVQIGYSYNIKDAFSTDSRFIEGPNISCPAGTCVTVIQEGTQRYLNILGRVFDTASIEAEIQRLETEISQIVLTWPNIANKPFNSVGTGLDVTNGVLNAQTIVNAISDLRDAIDAIVLAWNNISNKPFETIGTGLDVDEGALIAAIEWAQIATKPFNTIGSGLRVNDGVLNARITWSDLVSKPFTYVSNSDFDISSEYTLYIRNKPEEFYSGQMIELRDILRR